MPTRRDFLTTALLLPALPGFLQQPARSQEPGAPAADWLKDLAQQLREANNLPAVWLAFNVEDRVEAAVTGVRRWGDSAPATLEDALTVASVSKPMVGLWIATLVDQGLLDYSTKALDVLPELRDACLPEHRDITLGQLLTHTAAVVRDARNFPNNLPLEAYPAERIREAKDILSRPSPPESIGRELYSNNGVTLAATMAERVAGEPYETSAGRFFRERLRLPSWGVWPMNLPADLSLPWPHAMVNGQPAPYPPSSVQFHFDRPSGSAHCTITDLAKFGLLSTNATFGADGLLKPTLWDELLDKGQFGARTTLQSYTTWGWDLKVYDHNGSLGTTCTGLRVLPDWRTAIAIHSNASGNEFIRQALDLCLDLVRKRRAQAHPPSPCQMRLTGVATVDESWQNRVTPTLTDPFIRIRVNFHIDGNGPTGDLQTTVNLGTVERRDNRFLGLQPGNHVLHFQFDNPKVNEVPAIIKLDALGTGGNTTPNEATYASTLKIQ